MNSKHVTYCNVSNYNLFFILFMFKTKDVNLKNNVWEK